MTPFQQFSQTTTELLNSLAKLEGIAQEYGRESVVAAKHLEVMQEIAKTSLLRDSWSFDALSRHLTRLSELVSEQLLVKAWKEHKAFSVTPRKAPFGHLKTEDRLKAARINGAKGGRVRSKAKADAARTNARFARSKKASG